MKLFFFLSPPYEQILLFLGSKMNDFFLIKCIFIFNAVVVGEMLFEP